MMDFRLSPHFRLSELTRTNCPADNTPNEAIVDNLRWLAHWLEVIRAKLGGYPILINSGYRSPEVNAMVGGSPRSEHMDGRAADIRVPAYGDAYAVCRAIEQMDDVPFNQLIYEQTWTHISVPLPGVEAKREVLTYLGNGRYAQGIVQK